MSWKQVSPQQLLASKKPSPKVTEKERNALIESLKNFHIRQLLEFEQKLDTSLPLLCTSGRQNMGIPLLWVGSETTRV